MTALRHVCILALSATAFAAQPPAEPAKAPPPAKNPGDASKPEAKGALTAEQRLAATAAMYEELSTYRDEGTLSQQLDVAGKKITSTILFTAFDRVGRFRWQFQHSSMPGGKPDHRYTIWSGDNRSFNSFWTLTSERKEGQNFDMPLAGATGVSGGTATAILPLLRVTKGKPTWGILTTNLQDPLDKGKEAVDGVECWKVKGARKFGDSKVVVWIDGEGLIRKVYEEMLIDPAKLRADPGREVPQGPKFTSYTTILIKPVINEPKIDDARFAPDEKNP